MPDVERLAPAKINLFLHVDRPDPNGYHPLQSLVAFADIGDRVRLTEAPGFTVSGPFSAGLSTGEDNLVMKAVRLFEAATSVTVRHGLHLDKQLPVASGLGGGSADAGGVFHLLREAYAPDLSDAALEAMAAKTGADGVMCLWARPAIVEGYGERLSNLAMPVLPCVLVNPLVECSTALIYKMFDEGVDVKFAKVQRMYDATSQDIWAFCRWLGDTRNDLQPPAVKLQTVINDVLSSLSGQPETLLARMSGSGATCFALCNSMEDADALGRRMQAVWPWVRVCRLG